ncbi:hypothetical protein PoB_002916300 [Plakobranchus ocellatus]|uniref:Uncharacterized protein n=1 Tax=Plakobranchus ocellatus TaxID=259542 RepID=A0AAV4A7F2_9GAST|nr:hypothetical protein PoB_002916300 [Plakobranchus ocellatus]
MFKIESDSVYPCAIRDKGSVKNEVRKCSATSAVTYTETQVTTSSSKNSLLKKISIFWSPLGSVLMSDVTCNVEPQQISGCVCSQLRHTNAMGFQRDCTFSKFVLVAFKLESLRQRTRQAPVHIPLILESTFDPGTRSGRVQAQSRLRTQSRFD